MKHQRSSRNSSKNELDATYRNSGLNFKVLRPNPMTSDHGSLSPIVEHQISWTPGHIPLDFHWSPLAIAASPLDRKVVGDGPRQQEPEGEHRKHHGKHHETLCVPPAAQASPWPRHNAPLS